MEQLFSKAHRRQQVGDNPAKMGRRSPGCNIYSESTIIIWYSALNRYTTWVQVPRGGSKHSTPSDPPGEFLLPLLTTLGSMDIEVSLAPKKETLPPGAQRESFKLQSTAASHSFQAPHIKQPVGKEKSPCPPLLHSSLTSDQKSLSEHQK